MDPKLTRDEEAALRELAKPGMLKRIVDPAILQRLIELGLAEQKLGGPVATPRGQLLVRKISPRR